MMDNKENKKDRKVRAVDYLTQDVGTWWEKSFVLIKKARIRTWKGILILAFISGLATATIMTVSFNIQSKMDAATGAVLTLFTDDTNITLENGSNTAKVDVLLDTHSNNVVAVKAVVKYDPVYFKLESWDMSNSQFNNDSCSYNGGQCQIINNDAANGEVTITVAKPSPGVNTDSGMVAELVFSALKTIITASPNIRLDYSTGSYEDSDVILDDGSGTDILSSAQGASVNVYTATCASFTYSDWSACQPDSTQSRTVVSSLPDGCYGGNPILSQDCNYNSTVACTDIQYSAWSDCQPDGTQSRTVTSKTPSDCQEENVQLTQDCTYEPPVCDSASCSEWNECQLDGTQTCKTINKSPADCVPDNSVTKQSCTFIPPACTDYTYTDWSTCQPDGTQSRQVISGIPAGCSGGKDPVTSGSCDYPKSQQTCTNFTYTDWGTCQSGGKQYRTVVTSTPDGCSGGTPVTEKTCDYSPGTCSNFTYSDWGACGSNGTQTRTALTSSPADCTGGSPILTQSCNYSNPSSSDDSKDEKSKDKEKPKFTDLPYLLHKHPGDMVWWKAKDNKKVVYYTYNFKGKKVKTKSAHFLIPANTRRGVYLINVKAYDKAGNSKTRWVTLIIN